MQIIVRVNVLYGLQGPFSFLFFYDPHKSKFAKAEGVSSVKKRKKTEWLHYPNCLQEFSIGWFKDTKSQLDDFISTD